MSNSNVVDDDDLTTILQGSYAAQQTAVDALTTKDVIRE
jgi:hypothetical protein